MTLRRGYCIDSVLLWGYPFFSSPEEGNIFGSLKHVEYILDCPLDFYWIKIVSVPLGSGVMLQFRFLSHYTNLLESLIYT